MTFTLSSSAPIPRLPEGFANTNYTAFGLSHEIGERAGRLRVRASGQNIASQSDCTGCEFEGFLAPDPWNAGGASCANGGPSANACSTTNSTGSCSVSCTAPAYACCTNPILQAPSCTCVR
jgi:hypothetical protein